MFLKRVLRLLRPVEGPESLAGLITKVRTGAWDLENAGDKTQLEPPCRLFATLVPMSTLEGKLDQFEQQDSEAGINTLIDTLKEQEAAARDLIAMAKRAMDDIQRTQKECTKMKQQLTPSTSGGGKGKKSDTAKAGAPAGATSSSGGCADLLAVVADSAVAEEVPTLGPDERPSLRCLPKTQTRQTQTQDSKRAQRKPVSKRNQNANAANCDTPFRM